jgi:anaerobic selenocysteine-containing dehydrogenase
VLTISPGGDGNDSFSDERIRIRPGTDRFLAAAVIRWLWKDRQIPSELLKQTKNPEKFLDLISGWTPENLARACDVSLADVERLRRWYRQDRPTATFVGAGLQRYRYGGENVRFINSLALFSGNIGISGGGSYYHLHAYGNLNLTWTRDSRKKSRRSMPIAAIGREISARSN